MKHSVIKNKDGLHVKISLAGNHHFHLLEAFQKCRQGACSCPTNAYQKLDKLVISSTADTIFLDIKAKNRQDFNPLEIEECINFNVKRMRAE